MDMPQNWANEHRILSQRNENGVAIQLQRGSRFDSVGGMKVRRARTAEAPGRREKADKFTGRSVVQLNARRIQFNPSLAASLSLLT